MKHLTTLVAVSMLALGLAGCGAGVNQNRNATTKSLNNTYGTPYTNGANYTSRNYNANANLNDQTKYSGNMGTNSIYKNGYVANQSYGYVIHDKTNMNVQQVNNIYVDRNVLAKAVGSVVTSVPGVNQSSVLVTDEDIFIGVQNVKDPAILKQVKHSAWGISPRYYKVYVSSNPKTIDQVKNLVAHTNSREHIDDTQLNHILKTDSQTVK